MEQAYKILMPEDNGNLPCCLIIAMPKKIIVSKLKIYYK